MIVLHVYLAAPNLRTAVLCLTSNYSKILLSGFIALVFFTVTYLICDIGLLLVNPSEVDTIAASIIFLFCCLLSHYPEVLYNLLMFTRHICSYISLLLIIGKL